jgi:hypothetical protein
MTDEELDYVESRLYRGFGAEVRPDLQIRAEIILQRKTVGGCSPPTQRSGGGSTRYYKRCRVAVPATLKQYIGLFSPPSWIGVCRSFFLATIPAIRTDDAHNAF